MNTEQLENPKRGYYINKQRQVGSQIKKVESILQTVGDTDVTSNRLSLIFKKKKIIIIPQENLSR